MTVGTRLAIVALGAALAVVGCGDDPATPPPAAPLGAALATNVLRAIDSARTIREPYRCAEIVDNPTAPTGLAGFEPFAIGRALFQSGDLLELGSVSTGRRDRTLVIGVVADARGAAPETLEQLAKVRQSFQVEKVELVLTLGGMGATEAALGAVLGALAHEATWPLVAIPGARESIVEHRRAIAALRDAGMMVVDGSRVRRIIGDDVMIATFPGASAPAQLLAGDDGCVHRPQDAIKIAALLAAHRGPTVWAGYTPPRQRGPGSSDVAPGGVHIGDLELGRALESARPHLVLHGMVDAAAFTAPVGRARLLDGAAPIVLGSGAIEALPVWTPAGGQARGSALIVTVRGDSLTWKRVTIDKTGHH